MKLFITITGAIIAAVVLIGLGAYIYNQNEEIVALKDSYDKKAILKSDYCLLAPARIMNIKVATDKMDDADYYRAAIAAMDADVDACDDASGSKFFTTLIKSY